MSRGRTTVFFDPVQLEHRPRYEWTFGRRIAHPETARRAERIVRALEAEPETFALRPPPRREPRRELDAVHDERLRTLYRTAEALPVGAAFHPSVFPKRHQTDPDPEDIHQAGYFCFDSGTPLASTTYVAAMRSAGCAVAAAALVAAGRDAHAYALCRPPGHHAQRDLFGGYCYFNNAALAATRLRPLGRGAIVDIDFHHGNGTQALFARDPTVFFASIHGDPRAFYPYFCGYADERGEGRGLGTTLNVPLPEGCDAQEYLRVLRRRVVAQLEAFAPRWLVVSAGFDTHEEDPIGAFTLRTSDYVDVGEELGRLGVPTVVVQEGGYATAVLGDNVVAFLHGLRAGLARAAARPARRGRPARR
jgi:acetoin utilization deacetylase AcuC-like enzyme